MVGEFRTDPEEGAPDSASDSAIAADLAGEVDLESAGGLDLRAFATTPIGLATVAGMSLVGGLAVWFMWRKPSDEDKAPSR